MSVQIPARYLIHSASLYEVVKDEYGPVQDRLISDLARVRFDSMTSLVKTANGTDIQCTALMFFDSVNSYPQNVQISVGNAILWDGMRYIVQDVERLYDEGKLHHLEVILSDG